MKKFLSWGISIGIAAASVLAGTSAFADEPSKEAQIVERLAPGLLSSDPSDVNLTVSATKSANGDNEMHLASTDDVISRSLSITINYASSVISSSNRNFVFESRDKNVKALAQANGNGFRVLTVLSGIPTGKTFDYTFDVPTDARLVRAGENYLLESGNVVLGSIADPWAIDSKGAQLKTHYEWKNRVLTQVLDEDIDKLAYPVILDPTWGYTYQYDLAFRASTNMARLKTCFNCYFPVAGVPRLYPKLGQLLPLTVTIFNFECTMGSTIQTADYASFQFNATRNHIDGFGSNIIFQFIQIGTRNYLVVDSYIVNSLELIRAPYLAAAGLNWQIFAWNLNSSTPRT